METVKRDATMDDDNNSLAGDDASQQENPAKAAFDERMKKLMEENKDLPEWLKVPRAKEEKYTAEQVAKIKKCPLHARKLEGGLWYAPNSFGYSTCSPGCNACAMGEEDRTKGLWMSGWGVPDEE